jgi:hypothetical protein
MSIGIGDPKIPNRERAIGEGAIAGLDPKPFLFEDRVCRAVGYDAGVFSFRGEGGRGVASLGSHIRETAAVEIVFRRCWRPPKRGPPFNRFGKHVVGDLP